MATILSVSLAAPSVSIMTTGTVHFLLSFSPYVSMFAFSTASEKVSCFVGVEHRCGYQRPYTQADEGSHIWIEGTA